MFANRINTYLPGSFSIFLALMKLDCFGLHVTSHMGCIKLWKHDGHFLRRISANAMFLFITSSCVKENRFKCEFWQFGRLESSCIKPVWYHNTCMCWIHLDSNVDSICSTNPILLGLIFWRFHYNCSKSTYFQSSSFYKRHTKHIHHLRSA